MDLTKKLLNWYRDNKRTFLWRDSDNLFHILLAEIFLRRTLSTHVELIYSDFIEVYSTPEDILDAPKNDIMNYLSKLGLQNQRYNILIDVCKKYSKKPENFFEEENLREINGLGDYIINATLCFGKNKRSVLYDANTKRIINRVYSIEGKEEIKEKLNNLLPKENYIDFNYSLLDFGSLICRSRSPRCKECFLNNVCNYYKNIEE